MASATRRLADLFIEARQAEWTESGRLRQVRGRDRQGAAAGKLTVAELEEEEQSLERLRRWFRELKTRDVLVAPGAAEAEARLKQCAARLEDYTEHVFAALHQM